MKDSNSSTNVLPSVSSHESRVHRVALAPPFRMVSMVALQFLSLLVPFACYFVFLVFEQVRTGALTGSSINGAPIALGFVVFYTALLLCWLNKDFVLSQSGIRLPFVYFWSAYGRLNRNWSELTHIIFSRSTDQLTTADQLVLTFQNGGDQTIVRVCVKLAQIDQLYLKKLMYAIVSNAPLAVIEPPLDKVALEFPTVSGIKHLNFHSFTSLWDEEFSTRYSPTLFVPLAPDDELKNGAIKISELVACGGSAAIYSAKDRDGTQVIVKEAVIPKNAHEDLRAKAIEMFDREAVLLSKLNHPNIAKVFDHFVENEHHYEVLEFIDGLDLRRFVKERGPQPEDFVLNWAEQICEILVYLHSEDPPIIHRDLTPDNLVLRVDAQLVLIDFGAANAFVGTATGTMVGKQSYMPPEQLRGKAVPQSDIYSLGATLYFLLTGQDPVPLAMSQVDKSINVSKTMNELLARCTATEVAGRHETAIHLLQEIRSIRSRLGMDAVTLPHKRS
ncbi:MAG: serine/threonine-protein kinase [Candidatus Melainabacteria bacterium]|nr:serine/threonine-protein kinase [Candidatus Melainabacteria bacterium]